MYGVPHDLSLTFLHSAELVQVCLGIHQIQLHFAPVGSLNIEGSWRLVGADGVELDCNRKAPRKEPYQLHRLLGKRVLNIAMRAPESIAIEFQGGEELQLMDDSSQHESFTIQPGNIVV